MIARDPRETWKYVLVEERALPREKQTVFDLRHLTLAQESALLDNLDRDSQGYRIRKGQGTERLNLVRTNLVGWSNLRDKDGREILFKATKFGTVEDDLLFRLPLHAREELAVAVESEMSWDPDEVGKSEPAAT